MFPMLLNEVANNHRLSPFFSLLDERAPSFALPLDIYENEERYELRLDVPGVAKDDLKLHCENDTLSVRGQRKSARDGATRCERWCGSFDRMFSLPDGVDTARTEASLKDGVLTIVLPKCEKAKPRQITVQ